jgi:alpha-1,3-glucan synthase
MERRMSSLSIDSNNFAPPRPFSVHSRVSSFDSIGSLADEKHSSTLNKAMDTFTDADGEVAQAFVQKLRNLSSGNSKGDLCIEKFLMKSEKQFFSDMKKEKLSAMSIRSRDSIMAGRTPSTLDGFRADCESLYR